MNQVILKLTISKRNYRCSETNEGLYKLRGSVEYRELSYESIDTEFHDFQKRVKVRENFAEVLEIENCCISLLYFFVVGVPNIWKICI